MTRLSCCIRGRAGGTCVFIGEQGGGRATLPGIRLEVETAMGKRYADDSGPLYDVPPAGYRGGGYEDSSRLVLWMMVGAVIVLLLFLAIAALADTEGSRPGAVRWHKDSDWIHRGGLVQPDRRAAEKRTVFITDPSMESSVQAVLRHLMKGEYRAIHSIGHKVMQERHSVDEFRQLMGSTMSLGQLVAAKLEEIDTYLLPEEEGGRVAILRYRAEFEGGRGTMVLTMAVDGDKWRPLSVDVTPSM